MKLFAALSLLGLYTLVSVVQAHVVWALFCAIGVAGFFAFDKKPSVMRSAESFVPPQVRKRQPDDDRMDREFDVIVLGAGVAGLLQVRHLQIYAPHLRVAIIDGRPADRAEPARDLKVGESTIFSSASFMAKDCGLHDYLVSHHCPKYALQYHWPKVASVTSKWDDYVSILPLNNPEIISFQINRAKFERDLLKMVRDAGALYIEGRVPDVDLPAGDAIKTVNVILNSHQAQDSKSSKATSASTAPIQLKGRHFVDAGGRQFLIGLKKKNLVKGPENLFSLDNASVWMRVADMDSSLFCNAVENRPIASWLYATNHFMGPGYWIWVIPIERNGSSDVSIGISFHYQYYDFSQFDTEDKFMSFLRVNQTMLYNWMKSGRVVDFQKMHRIPFLSKTVMSQDNWYVVGDSAQMADPFYSTGMSMIAVEVEQITEIIKAKTAKQANAAEMCDAYNNYAINMGRTVMHLISHHDKHLGHASAMSWRIYMEGLKGGALGAVSFLNKSHLMIPVGKMACKASRDQTWFMEGVYQLLDKVVAEDINIGFMDYNEPGLIKGFSGWKPLDIIQVDDTLSEGKFNQRFSTNIPYCSMISHTFCLFAFVTMCWRILGARMFVSELFWSRAVYLVKTVGLSAYNAARFAWNRRGMPVHEQRHHRAEAFKAYKYTPKAFAW